MPKITPHEALIYVMITMSAVDRQISDHELERIAQIVRQLPVFMGFDINNLAKHSGAMRRPPQRRGGP